MSQVFLSLGANLGNRYQMLENAIFNLTKHAKIKLKKPSSVYETKPFGYIDQPDFLNMVVEIDTSLKPFELLEFIHEVEDSLGRTRDIHWGPRTIDIDILLFDGMIIKNENLQIPHPYLAERLFVLVPLAEIYSGKIPGSSMSLNELIDRLDKEKGVVRVWET